MKRKNNYLDVIEKRAKSCFKGKFKVTLALIVSLMISGVAMAVEEDIELLDGKAIWESSGDIDSDTGFGVKVTGSYPSADELLTSKAEVDLTNSNTLTVIGDGDSTGIYIPGTDKLFEFYLDETIDPFGNSYFRVDNSGKIDVDGLSAYGIHLKFVEPIEPIVPLSIVALDDTKDEEEEDPVYAYPDIEIDNSGEVNVKGEVEAEGIKIDSPFAKVSIDNSGSISGEVGVEEEEITKEKFGGSTGINILLNPEEEVAENPTPDWEVAIGTFSSDEEGISSLPMDIDITNTGSIDVDVENRDVARIMGINVGEYDDHTLTDTTEIIEPVEEEVSMNASAMVLSDDIIVTALEDDSHESGGKHGSGGSGGCGTKPLDAMVFSDITNEGSIDVTGKNLSAVQAVGVNSRMAEGTQTTIINGEGAEITVDVEMQDARQTTIDEDPTSGNLYGINVFNSGRPSRVDTINAGSIDVKGSILEEGTDKTAEDPVGIQAFGIKNKARGRDSVADISNTGEITVTTSEMQNTKDMDYTYTRDTEGKEIFGARAVGIAGTSAGRGAHTEITNGNYDITIDQEAMDDKRANEDVDVYALIQADMMRRYEEEYEQMYTYEEDTDTAIVAKIDAYAESDQGFAEAKGIWSTAEAIENSQFIYNTEDSEIIVGAKAKNRGAEALGIESVSYQNYVINKGLIDVEADGKTATGIGILAEVSEIEEEEMNEHMKKPEFLGADIGMPPDLPGNRDDHQGGENSGGGEDTVTALFSEPVTAEISLLATEEEGTPNGEISQGENGSGDGATTDTNQPEIGIRNKYILNTGDISVDVNQKEDVDSNFAFGAGIASSRVVLETVRDQRVNDFAEVEPVLIQAFAMAGVEEEPADDIDGTAGATTASPEESLNQYITNNGSITVLTEGDTALASGISSLTKVEVLFDTDGDGVTDGVDIAPINPELSKDLDGDGIDDKVDADADGDGFYADLNGDGIPDGGDPDDPIDYFDHDSDNDGINNRMDNDDDGDGIMDADDPVLDQIFKDGKLVAGFYPISDEAYEEFMDTPGGMPENLIETTGILEPEEAEINNNLVNNGSIIVGAVSDSAEGKAIANGIATDVVWAGLQKPVYEAPDAISIMHSVEEEPELLIIERNYDNFVNSKDASITATATTKDGTAAAFGMRIGNYYTIDDAASERSPVTKHYAGNYDNTEEEFKVTEYGMVNDGTIATSATGLNAKSFGMMSGYSRENGKINEEFVVSTVKNTGTIDVSFDGEEGSEGAGIVAFADQQIEYLPEVLEGGVLLAVVEEDEDDHDEAIVALEEEVPESPVFEDYVVKDPEDSVVIVENTGTIKINSNSSDKNYGIYAGINMISDEEKYAAEGIETIKTRKIEITPDNIDEGEPIIAETQNGNDGESVPKQIGTLYTVTDTDGSEYQFVIHAPEDMGEDIPDAIYVVDSEGSYTPSVKETHKTGDTYLRVNNTGTIDAGSEGTGIYLASKGVVENSGRITAEKAIVTSGDDDIVNLNNGSIIAGDIETGDGDDSVSMSKGSITSGDIRTGDGNDTVNLSDGSELKGNIFLGEGDDHFIVKAGAGVGVDGEAYTVDGGNGEDRITLNGNKKKNKDKNIIDSNIQNFENAKIHGEWTLKGNGGINVDKGDIVIDKQSTLIVAMTGTPETLEGGDIIASKLVVDGNLTYDIKDVEKLGENNLSYQLSEGMEVTSNSGEEVELSTNTYAWTAEVGDNKTPEKKVAIPLPSGRSVAVSTFDIPAEAEVSESSSISFERVGFEELASGDNKGIAKALDDDYEDSDASEAAEVYDILENDILSTSVDEATATSGLNKALEDISGTEYAAYPFINLSISRAFEENTRLFMETSDDREFTGERTSRIELENGRGVYQYMNFLGNFGDYDGSDTENFDFDTYGVILATEKELDPSSKIGITYGYADTQLDFDDGGSGETDTFHVGGYHRLEKDRWIVKSILAFDYNKNDMEREVLVGDNRYKPTTDFDSYVISVASEVGYDYPVGHWMIRPIAGLAYSRVEQDSFKEDTIVGLEKSSQGYNSLVSEAGVRAIREFLMNNTKLKLHFNISWLHEYGDIYDSQDLKFSGNSYDINGLDVSDNIYRIGAGAEVETNSSWSFNVRGSYEEDSSYDGYKLSTGFKYTF